ncbi:MAG: bacillithiol biosynthesis deacetylase BshB1 [Planctomycetota bacterium]
MDLPEPVDILAFAPHPDDVELCAGGLMLRMSDAGKRLAVVDMTRGEGGSRGTPEGRAREVEAASRLMGLVGRENLGLPDTAIEVSPAMTEPVIAAIRRWRPRIVLGPCSYDLHPDHVAAAGLVARAYYLSTIHGAAGGGYAPHRPDALLQYYGHKEPEPSFVVDISDVWERRVTLANCFASQLGLDDLEGPLTNISSPDFGSRVEARFAYWGSRIGARYGEPYLVDRVVPVDDPVDVFRKRGWAVL